MRATDLRHVLPELLRSDVAFDQAAIGMAMVDFDGHFLRVNAALCDLVGRPEPDLLTRRWQDISHPDDVGPGERAVERTLAGTERSFRLAKRYVRGDGDLIWVLLSVSLIHSTSGEPLCLFTQAVDVTEQRRAEEGVARLASIVESSDDAILSKTLDGTILSWNQAAERMYGYTATEMVGQSMLKIVPPELRTELHRQLDLVARGQSIANHETTRMRKDGSLVDVSITLSPIRDTEGDVVRASVIARDITEQKRMVAQLDATLAALETALREARTAEERSQRFLSDAAHQLRNPIAGIGGCAEALLRGCSLAEQERLVADIAREASRVGRLVDRLLRLERLERGEPLMLSTSDLISVCRDEVQRLELLSPDLTIVMRAAGLAPFQFDADAVAEILRSLLDNARRHAREGIEVTVECPASTVTVRVVDDGDGVPAHLLERAFEPFVALDGKGGFGLGLSISRALARAHGGDLVVAAKSFVLSLPYRPV